MIPLGQFRDTFIIAVDDEGVAIIDQHVAHERVLFERVMERLTAGRLESQRLLMPMLMDLSPAQQQALVRQPRAELERFGFEIEEFGGDSDQGDGGAGAAERPRTARGRCGRWPRISRGSTAAPGSQDALQRIAATTACHAAVKANYPLTLEKMRTSSTSCAGRPTRASARTAGR